MDAVVLHGSLDQSLSPYKSNSRNPKKIQYSFISRSSENFLPSHFQATGLLQAPPPFLSQSYPPYSLQQPQPPLLPLPTANPRRSATTYPPAYKKINNGSRARDSSLTPKKSKSLKKEERNSPRKPTNVSSSAPLGAHPKEVPKDVTNVFPLISSSSGIIISNRNNCISRFNSVNSPAADEVDMFSGSAVFTISPPPSSLPLPTFSLRPKLSCKAEAAAGIDAGATDDLRRLLRLR